MKKALIAILFAFASTTAFAQGPSVQQASQATKADEKTLEQRAEEITASMAKHLRLTPEQKVKIRDINLSSMRFAEEAKEKYKEDPRRIVQQMDIISQTRLSQIKDVLTRQQFQQYQQRREEKMGVPREAQTNPGASRQSSLHQESY